MTNEEAKANLERLYPYLNEEGKRTLDLAIEALERQNADGCEGCKYMMKDIYEMPCLVCKRSKEDMWRNIMDWSEDD